MVFYQLTQRSVPWRSFASSVNHPAMEPRDNRALAHSMFSLEDLDANKEPEDQKKTQNMTTYQYFDDGNNLLGSNSLGVLLGEFD